MAHAERDATITKRSMWMLRVVDAPGAIAARGSRPGLRRRAARGPRSGAPRQLGSLAADVADGKGALTPTDRSAEVSAGPRSPAAAPLRLGARGLAALYAGTPVGTLRLSGLAAGGSPDDDAALDAVFAATAYMLDDF